MFAVVEAAIWIATILWDSWFGIRYLTSPTYRAACRQDRRMSDLRTRGRLMGSLTFVVLLLILTVYLLASVSQR